MMSKKAFTLLEVLIAIAIFSIVAIEVLKISSTHKQISSFIHQKEQLSQKVSFVIDTLPIKKDEKKIYFKDFVKNLYLKDSLLKRLDTKIFYKCSISQTFDENGDENSTENSTDNDNKQKATTLFYIYKQNFQNKNGRSIHIYRIVRR